MLEPTPSSGSGGDGTNLDAEIAAHVASLHDLEAKLEPETQVSDDPELGFHQLEFLELATWGGLDPMVRFCVPRMLEHGPKMHPEHMNECIKESCDEYVVKGHRRICRRKFVGQTVGLNELAKEVFNPHAEEYGEFRKRLKRDTLWGMRDIGLWNVTEYDKQVSKNGVEYHGGFEITAGPVLLAFHRHIYIPYAIRRAKVACKLLNRRDN